jgi:selenocysteine lyase/cysteine desulfurase
MEIERWRREFVACQRTLHFNHAGVAPVSTRVTRAVTAFLHQAEVSDAASQHEWDQRMAQVRGSFARLIGATAREIAFVTNTSEGISVVAGGIDWHNGDNAVVIDGDYPSNVYPWWGQRRFGVEIRMVKTQAGRFGVDEIRGAVDSRTRTVAVSAVDWQTGFRCDLTALGAFCRERGILFCVDGIQAVGALQIDVERQLIDCLAAGGHKWLMGPHGCGGLYVSERIVERLHPVLLGWKSIKDAGTFLPYHFELRSDAGRFEPGSPPFLGIHAFGAALELLHEAGAAAIESRIFEVTAQLAAGLGRRGPDITSPWGERERSGILTFRLGGDPVALTRALHSHDVICRVRAGGVRLAPHFYISDDDVTRFFTVLDHVTASPSG